MTTITLYVRRQFSRTVESPRRLTVIVLLLTMIAATGAFLTFRAAPDALRYNELYITPTPVAVCPGDSFAFPVDIAIRRAPSISRVTEGWCRIDGICPKALQDDPVYYNLVTPYSVSASATRTAPTELTPGTWELRHCNEAHASGIVDVSCYAVRVEIDDCR
jgi:hypothetical protein